jgi:multidrug efflux pump subunit AcrA (membrane-fusion protein)
MNADKKAVLRVKARGGCGWTIGILLGALVVLGFVASGCSKGTEVEAAPTVTVQVGAAENQTIERKVSAEATLYPLEQSAIVPKITAPVKKFYVEKGSKVHAGQLLAELENSDLLAQKLENDGNFAQAQAGYEQAGQKAEQDRQLAKETLDAAQKLYDARRELYKQGAVSAKDVDDANVALIQAKNVYEASQKQLDLKVAEGQFAAAKAKTTEAEVAVNYSRIVSPIDGVVTDRPFYPGEMASNSGPIITIMNLSQIVARAHIDQSEASQLKVGDPATISVPGQPGALKGKVSLVSPALDPNSTTVEVWVQAPNPGDRLKPGSSVQAQMVAQAVQHAIVIPAEALLTGSDGTTSVIVLDTDNKPHKKKVKVGIRDGGDVQVTEGLQGGERVVTVGAFALSQEDDPVLAKTNIQVQAPPNIPDEDDEDQ